MFRIKSPRGTHGLHGSFVVGFEDKEGIPNSFGPSVRGTCIDSLLGIVIYVSGFGHADSDKAERGTHLKHEFMPGSARSSKREERQLVGTRYYPMLYQRAY